ncbi:Tripartite-type tricarboxylate transporter, receptor component TctC [Micromonospora pallida]|uniref:Tripartite-type tricarboxylate transporter, receptor component TctC n=1 Tax=Micromonospora pallida TaxID=145854 RepID=A0A1C6SG74_9ACTN|nr:tripartite tricarboxylate transporter substrate binding protein [Micromonospora pallida]SCL28403.1 Tripartite-type tricarboxylate transporter, receptor component TctC [Micromonospora pallida]
MRPRAFLAVTAALAISLPLAACGPNGSASSAGDARNWPRKGKPIELVVSFAPGGAVDTAARLVAPILEKELGTNVEVVNKPGAGGQIGYTALTSAKPDGYTIGATGSPSVVVSPLDKSRGAKYTRESFQPLGMQVIDPAVVGVAPDSPYHTLGDLIAAAKTTPGKITASTTGLQTGEHFAAVDIEQKTGGKFALVHFSEGASQAIAAFLGGHVQVYVGSASDVTDLVKQKKIKLLGVMGEERSEFLPDTPTFKEQGVDVISATARGYSAPAGLPAEVAAKLEAALKKAIEDPAVASKMKALGLQTSYLSGVDYKTFWSEQEETVKAVLPLVIEK